MNNDQASNKNLTLSNHNKMSLDIQRKKQTTPCIEDQEVAIKPNQANKTTTSRN